MRIKTHHLLTGEGIAYGASIYLLNEAWYKDYPRTSLHWFNDNKEWLQIDKVGHAYAAYQLTNQNAWLIKSTGVNYKNAALISSGISLATMSSIELFDGLSKEWGASWGDLSANTLGVALFLSQELTIRNQLLRLKYSYKQSPYAKTHPDKLGRNAAERILKDYNAQTYWISTSIRGIAKNTNIPPWIAIAVGYGAHGMTGGYDNREPHENIKRYRQFYLSPDIDWQRIKTKNKTVKILFRALNMIKVPMPALAIQKKKLVVVGY